MERTHTNKEATNPALSAEKVALKNKAVVLEKSEDNPSCEGTTAKKIPSLISEAGFLFLTDARRCIILNSFYAMILGNSVAYPIQLFKFYNHVTLCLYILYHDVKCMSIDILSNFIILQQAYTGRITDDDKD